MILLDSSVIVPFFLGQPPAEEVARILETGESAVPAANLTETIDVLVRVRGFDRRLVDARLVPLLEGKLPVVPAGEDVARRAAELRITHYHRRDAPVSLAGCLLLATALVRRGTVATSDGAVARVARSEGIELVALPNSSGIVP